MIRMEEVKGLTLPPDIVRLFSLEFPSLSADLLFVRASQFYGGKIQRMEEATEEDWQWLYRNLDLVTELDPWFQDPYYMGNAFLTWDAGMISEANMLLQKATDARYWDWIFPFYLGFNKFYFQGDRVGGAESLLKASERPGSWDLLPTLAARLYYEVKKTDMAIAFMKEMLERELDPGTKRRYEIRLDALNKISFLEEAVEIYKSKMGVTPLRLEKLLDAMIIKEIPGDPYGGNFYIDKDGNIRTTSKLAFKSKAKE